MPRDLPNSLRSTRCWAKCSTYVFSFLINGSLYLHYSWAQGQVAFRQGLWAEPVWTESVSSLPKNKHRGQGPLLWHTEGARTLGSISGSTSYYLAGLGQVTVFVLWLSHLSNDDLIPTPPWAVGRFHCIEHPAQCLAFFWLCSVLFLTCWAWTSGRFSHRCVSHTLAPWMLASPTQEPKR